MSCRRPACGEARDQAVPHTHQPDPAAHTAAPLGQPPRGVVPSGWLAAFRHNLRGAVLRHDLHLAGVSPCEGSAAVSMTMRTIPAVAASANNLLNMLALTHSSSCTADTSTMCDPCQMRLSSNYSASDNCMILMSCGRGLMSSICLKTCNVCADLWLPVPGGHPDDSDHCGGVHCVHVRATVRRGLLVVVRLSFNPASASHCVHALRWP